MECPICYTEYNSDDRRPLRAFCACKRTLCLSCIESMLKNASFCPWDKTRWSGRNLMSKFVSNTPPNYLNLLIKQSVSEKQYDQTEVLLNLVELGSGELRNEYLRQQKVAQDRILADKEAQMRKDEELAVKLEKEAEERANMLNRIEQEDMKFALSMSNDQPILQTTNRNSLGGLINHKNTILYSMNKQLVEKIKHQPVSVSLSDSPFQSQHRSVGVSYSVGIDEDGWISSRSASSVPSSSSKHVDIKKHFMTNIKPTSSLFGHRTMSSNSTSSSDVHRVSNHARGPSSFETSSASANKGISFFHKRIESPSILCDRLNVDEPVNSQNIAPANTDSQISDGIYKSQGEEAINTVKVIETIELSSDDSDSSLLGPPSKQIKTNHSSSTEEVNSKRLDSFWTCTGCTYKNSGTVDICEMCGISETLSQDY